MNFNEWKEDLNQRLQEHLVKNPESKPASAAVKSYALDSGREARSAQSYIDEMMSEELKFDIINMAVLFENGRIFFVPPPPASKDPLHELECLISEGGTPLGLIGLKKNSNKRNPVFYCKSFEEQAYAGDCGSGWAYDLLREYEEDWCTRMVEVVNSVYDTAIVKDGWIGAARAKT
jgi:hypothetical protein